MRRVTGQSSFSLVRKFGVIYALIIAFVLIQGHECENNIFCAKKLSKFTGVKKMPTRPKNSLEIYK